MIIRHETVVFIPGRKYRSKTTGIDRLESVARMHKGQYRMPALLYVPQGCLDNYRYTAPWSYFGTIREFEPTGIRPTLRSKANQPSRTFDLQGRPVLPGSHGIRIEQTPDGVRKVNT